MSTEVAIVSPAALAAHARVSIAFEVDRVLGVTARDGGLGGLVLAERRLAVPYRKDYDAHDGGPAEWARRFDLTNWGLFEVHDAGGLVGAAAVAFDTPGVDMLEGRRDLAVLWDLRVAPEARGRGVGTALFRAAEAWATARGCRQLKVETQSRMAGAANVNVPACRFYARAGCVLGAVHRFAYPGLPDEAQLLWYRALSPPAG